MTINARLLEFMQESGLTQIDLAKLLGVSRQNVNSWFTKGTTISDKMILKVISVLEEIDARWLVTGKKQEAPAQKGNKVFTTTENYDFMLNKLMESQRTLGSVETENRFLKERVVELKDRIVELENRS